MSRATFRRDGLGLAFEETGSGPAVLFQHGLGADAAQVAEIFPDLPVRRVTLECRGQGGSDLGPAGSLSIAAFAGDVAALAGHLGIGTAVAGGISMGAAIALRLAVRRPDLVRGLVLARPAWTFGPAPENMAPFALAARLLAAMPPAEARAEFERSEIARRLAAEAPDNLASLRGFFDRPDPAATAALLGAIAADGPGIGEAEAKAIAVPTLVIGNGEDLVHPLALAERLAATIPGARLVTITSKVVSRARYVAEFRAAVGEFLAGARQE